VQVSIGVGMAIATDASSQLFARADAALYVVKGRRHVLVLAPAEGARRDAGAQR
jgi:predicted signal transduction protein with EAL and GGDEF domain